jgi:hypothetical protein
MPVPEQKALAMCDSIRECDDRIGRYSDHEGNKDGPTYYFWAQGKTKFEEHALRAIHDHQLALKAWRKALKLNDKR